MKKEIIHLARDAEGPRHVDSWRQSVCVCDNQSLVFSDKEKHTKRKPYKFKFDGRKAYVYLATNGRMYTYVREYVTCENCKRVQ